MIFLEDIHWADDSSLDAFNLLGRRSQKLPLVIFGLARPSLNSTISHSIQRLEIEELVAAPSVVQ